MTTRVFEIDLPPEEQMLETTPGIVGAKATPIIGAAMRDLPGPLDPLRKAVQQAPTSLPTGPIERLPDALRKKADRWSIAFGTIPVAEIMAIAVAELGESVLTEGIPPGLAETFVARWIVQNEFRMTRELREVKNDARCMDCSRPVAGFVATAKVRCDLCAEQAEPVVDLARSRVRGMLRVLGWLFVALSLLGLIALVSCAK